MKQQIGQAQSSLLALIGGMLLICAFAVSFLLFLQGGDDTYSVTYNETAYQGFNQSQNIINLTKNTNEKFIQLNNTGTQGALDIITVITTGGYNTLIIIGGIPSLYNSIIVGAGQVLGIPAAISTLAFNFVIAIIIMVFILLVFRVRS